MIRIKISKKQFRKTIVDFISEHFTSKEYGALIEYLIKDYSKWQDAELRNINKKQYRYMWEIE